MRVELDSLITNSQWLITRWNGDPISQQFMHLNMAPSNPTHYDNVVAYDYSNSILEEKLQIHITGKNG